MKLNPYEAIIILSHEMDINGKLNEESSLRADKAKTIFQENRNSKIITCGWDYLDGCSLKLCEAVASYLNIKHKISFNSLIQEPNSRDTVGDAVFTRKNIVDKKKFTKLAVVSSFYHLPRVKEIFEFVYGEGFNLTFFSSNFKNKKNHNQNEQNSLNIFRSTFSNIERGNIQKIYKRLIDHHPLYKDMINDKFSMN